GLGTVTTNDPAQSRRSRSLRRAEVGVALVAACTLDAVLVASVTSVGHRRPPRLALAAGSVLESGSPRSGSGLVGPSYPYSDAYTAASSLSSTSGVMPVYTVSWPSTAMASANQLATTLGVATTQSGPSANGGVEIGAADGPSIEVDPAGSHLRWSYEASPAARSSTGPATTDSEAISTPERYLAAIGKGGANAGPAQVSDYSNGVGVIVPVTVGGEPTTLESDFVFGPSDTLRMASGSLADFAESTQLTTLSAQSAVSALNGTTHYGPEDAAPACGSPPVCTGTIDTASLEYRPYTSVSGQEELLPVWMLGSTVQQPGAPEVGGWVCAIPASLIEVQSGSTKRFLG